jgi:DNA-binding NtrC family response regulator/tetratricopeptide (TPR) repeat protein
MPVADARKVKGLAGGDLGGWWCNNHHQPDGPAGIGAAVDQMGDLLGESPGIAAVREKLARLLQLQSGSRALPPILIQGETGTGKGLLARAIHRAGPRAAAPFIDVNCAAIPETLLEAEMFGFERGAFTDAKQAKAGLFQAAHGGTIFLDEVGLLPDAVQAKLLKVIEERSVRRLGSTRSEPVDAWIITATNEDLATAIRHRRFREDLYHRLAVLTLWLPPLRERGEDVLRLADNFLARACAEYDLPARTLGADARTALLAHPWPGNIRELSNVIERVALLSEGPSVSAEMLGLPERGAPRPQGPAPENPMVPLDEAVGSAEREHLLQALERTDWNISRAAAELRISRNTLRYRIEKHGLGRGTSPVPVRRRVTRSAAPAPAPAVPEAVETPGPARVRWERRRITLLRAALVSPPPGATVTYTSRAPEILVEKVQTFGGRVEELSPTGIVASFGLDPVEDAPRLAANSAMAVQKSAERSRRQGVDLGVTVGIHVGQFLVGESGGGVQIDLDGKREAWDLLEALVAGREPDSIVVSAAAAPFLDRRFDLTPAGPMAGAAGPAYRLTGRERSGLGLGRPRASFVGRRQDIELLQSRLASVMTGHGQIVGVVGDAGIGKSRLIFEFRQSLRHQPIAYLEGHCLSYGASVPYLPVLEILRQSLGITEGHAPGVGAEKVRAGLAAVGMEPDEWAPYLLLLLGIKEGTERLATLSPEAIKSRTLEAMRQLGLKASRQRPVVFVLEDLHWIDKTSEECVAAMVESLAGTPTLFLATYRPGYRPGWMDKSYATQIALQPLSEDDSMAVVRSVLPSQPVPDPLARMILEKAEGNPFFLEELSRAVREQGDLGAIPAVPDTIHDVLAARIQRLPADARNMLQTASVLGREVSAGLLRAVSDGAEAVDAALADLTSLEFLHPWSEAGESVYVFKHALTQEVAYESLMPDRRQAIHVAAGRALERFYEGRLQEVYDRLAHHYARTGETAKAVEYLARFADKSARGYAHDEAVKALTEALSHVERLPADIQDRKRIELILRLPRSLTPLGRLSELFSLLLGERDRVERLQDPALAAHYHYVLGRAYMLGPRDLAMEHARRALAEAERCGDPAAMGRAYGVLAVTGALSGEVARGIEDGRRAVTLLEKTEDLTSLCYAYWALGQCCARIGAFEDAMAAAVRARSIAEAIGDQPQQASATWVIGIVHAAMGNGEEGIAACQGAVQMTRDALNRAIATGWLGYAYLEKGDAARAIASLEQSIPFLHEFGVRALEGWFTAFLADAHRLEGNLERAEAVSLEALHMATEADSRVAVGWAQLALGRIAHARSDLETAATRLTAALAIFTDIQSRYECARTHLDLATVAQARGDGEAAGRHLNEAHGLFTALGAPQRRERVEQLAADWRMPLGSHGADPARREDSQ